MSFVRQAILSLAVLAAALYVWIAHVPAARPVLDRLGILDILGIETAEATPESGEGSRGSGGPAQVAVVAVEERVLEDRVTAIGDGRAERSVTVRSETVGLITELPVTPGLRVEAGDVVAQLDQESETIALERAQLVLEDARADNERIGQLRDTGAITGVALREAQLALRTAELGERQARFDLAQRRVTAPISGVVGILDVEVGDRVGAQASLATITDRSSILIDFRIPERVITRTDPGMEVEVKPLGGADTPLEGVISAIDTVVDRASRTLRVQARVDNADDRLRAGMAFSVALTFPGETLIAIDPLSLQWSSEGAFVWVIRDGRSEQVPVTIRQRNSASVLVDADLTAGERIVTEGVQNLRPGSEVSVAQDTTSAREGTAPPARL